MVKQRLGLTLCGALAACSVSAARVTTGPVYLDGGSADGGDGGGGAVCPSALVVASSDYTSTNISVLSASGAILSESIVSSASAPPGLTTALSGDVVLPLAPTPGKIVLIDRYPNSVLSWVDPATAAVIHQLPVGTGFGANPHDYLEVSQTKAYVSRYESNAKAGQQPNDGGGDLLIINPQAVSITGRVPFAAEGAFLPRPDRMMRVGGEVWVSLLRFDADSKTAGDARLVGVSTTDDSIAWSLDLPGVANCGAIAMAPAGKVVAVACTGVFGDANPAQRSGLVLLDVTAHPPVEIKRFAVASQLGAPLGSALAYASDSVLVGVALGDMQAGRNDMAYALDVGSGMARVLADAGVAYAFSDVRCAPGCNDLCFLTDGNARNLRVWKANGAQLSPQAPVTVDPTVGLPPRVIGAFF
jgi:hypothetical protein